MEIRYLVFSGGGAAGYAFAGAVKRLSIEPEFSFDKIKAVAGSSVGTIAALIVCLNYPTEEASKKILALDLKKLEQGSLFSQAYRLFSQYGKSNAESLFVPLKMMLEEKTGRKDVENITFADLKRMGFKDLYVQATKIFKENNVPTGKQKIFSHETTPNTSVLTAVRAAIAAPVYFSAVRLRKISKGTYVLDKTGHLFEDGGLLNNFPIGIFDKPKYQELPDNPNAVKVINPYVLGLALRNTYQINDKHHTPIKQPINNGQPIEFVQGLMNGVLDQLDNAKFDKANRLRTIQIDRLNVKFNDFNISEEMKNKLSASGNEAVKAYFADLRAEVQEEKEIHIVPIMKIA